MAVIAFIEAEDVLEKILNNGFYVDPIPA